MKRKAYLYQRFSSERQRGNSSIFRQTEAQTAWLARHPDVEVAERLVDDGISAYKGDNAKIGTLGALVRKIEEGKIQKGSLILVEHFSRLSRQNIDKTEELLRKIWKGDITIVTVRDGMEYPPSSINDMAQRIRLIVEIEKAYSESKWRSEKVKGSYLRREQEALLGKPPRMRRPFWLNKDGTLNKHHLVIKSIYKHFLDGYGQHRIIDRLKEEFGEEAKPVASMDPSTIIRIIRGEIVLGKWRGMQVYEPAIDTDQYFLALQELERRGNRSVQADRDWLLSGLLVCGHCGTGMTIQQTKNAAPVLRCSSKRRSGGKSKCTMRYVFPYYLANAYFLSLISGRIYFVVKNIDLSAEQKVRTAEIEVKLGDLAHEKLSLEEEYQELTSERLPTGWVIKRISQIEQSTEELQAELQKLKVMHPDFDFRDLKGSKLKKELKNMEDFALSNPLKYKKHFHDLGLKLQIKDGCISTVVPNPTVASNFPTSINLKDLPIIEYLEYSRNGMKYLFNIFEHNNPTGIRASLPTKLGQRDYNF